MRTIRLRSKGISLRKIAIRANNKIVRVTGRGCAAIPTSTRMLVVAYKPDVTAYHLCMIKLRKSRTRVTFKLTDANLVPPAKGDCSR
jgi:hypothetical protein